MVARLMLSELEKQFPVFPEGMADPLILSFQSPSPIYPLALTATGGFDTEVLLYVFGDKQYECGGRVKLRYSGFTKWDISAILMDYIPDLGIVYTTPILTKFKQTLSPEEMREDLVFEPVAKHKPYRETVWVW